MQQKHLKGRSILIVEDEVLIALGIELALADSGAELTITSVLEHALILVEHDGLSAAILDHTIGGENSSRLYKRLRDRNIPFLIYSAHDLPEAEREGGVLLSKPALPDAILAAVERLLLD